MEWQHQDDIQLSITTIFFGSFAREGRTSERCTERQTAVSSCDDSANTIGSGCPHALAVEAKGLSVERLCGKTHGCDACCCEVLPVVEVELVVLLLWKRSKYELKACRTINPSLQGRGRSPICRDGLDRCRSKRGTSACEHRKIPTHETRHPPRRKSSLPRHTRER